MDVERRSREKHLEAWKIHPDSRSVHQCNTSPTLPNSNLPSAAPTVKNSSSVHRYQLPSQTPFSEKKLWKKGRFIIEK